MKTKLLLSLIFFLPSFPPGGNKWEMKKNENGIVVYNRIAENSGLKEVKVVNTVKSSLAGLVALIFDTPNYTNWIYRCSEAKTIKKISDQEEYMYQVTAVPFPFDNRDVVTDAKAAQDPQTKVVTITSLSIPTYVPEKKGIERVKHYKSEYTLTPISKDSVKIELLLFVDPGGNVPDWLINANIVQGPYSTTVEMLKQLPKYQSVSVSFIKEKQGRRLEN